MTTSLGIALLGVGFLLLWGGVTGRSILDELRIAVGGGDSGGEP